MKSWFFLTLIAVLLAANDCHRRVIIIEDESDESEDYRLQDLQYLVESSIPDPSDVAAMARFIVHKANWTSVAYISHQTSTMGKAIADMWSVSDGPENAGSGVPYFYVSRLEIAVTDLLDNDNHCSLMMSLAETDICKKENWDPEDPRCAHVIMTGTFQTINNNSAEFDAAKNAVFTRHPDFVHLPSSHQFFLAKINIDTITVQDYFGGPANVPVSDYFNVHNEYEGLVSRYPKLPHVILS